VRAKWGGGRVEGGSSRQGTPKGTGRPGRGGWKRVFLGGGREIGKEKGKS